MAQVLWSLMLRLAQVRKRRDPKERILLSNMEGNGWDRIVCSTKGWAWTQPLREGDVVLNDKGHP